MARFTLQIRRRFQTQHIILPAFNGSAAVVKLSTTVSKPSEKFVSSSRVNLQSQRLAWLLGSGVAAAAFAYIFIPSHEDRLVTAAKQQVRNRLANPASAVFSDMRVAKERVQSWTSLAVHGCVKERSPTNDLPVWRGFAVEDGDVSFRPLYCPFLP